MELWLQSLIFLCCGVFPALILFGGLRLALRTARYRQKADLLTGTVVEVEQIHHLGAKPGQEWSFRPVFEFDGGGGQRRRAPAQSSGAGLGYPIGTRHKVFVDLNHTASVQLPGPMPYITAAVMVGIGATGVTMTTFLLLAV